jgi:hypothetical protein
MQAYPAAIARRIVAFRLLQEVRQSTQAPPATAEQAVVPRQRVAPLTDEAIIRAINNMTPRQFERWQMSAELAVLRVSLACAPQEHQYNQDVMQRLKLEERAARRPTPRSLLALAGVFIAVGFALPPTQAQARIVCFLLAAVADKFHLLNYGLAVILVFIGTKMCLIDIYKIPVTISLGVVIGILAITMVLSVRSAAPKADA